MSPIQGTSDYAQSLQKAGNWLFGNVTKSDITISKNKCMFNNHKGMGVENNHNKI